MRMKLQSFISLSLSMLLALSVSPAIAEECPNGICEVVFESTGNGVYFETPANAQNLTFVVSGAAGGRGGNGGRVTGSFLETPVGSELPVATATPIAQLASLETDAASRESFVGAIAPWLTGGVVIGALVFLGYRKMMVR